MLKMRRVWRRTSSSQADPSPWRHCWTSWASCSNVSSASKPATVQGVSASRPLSQKAAWQSIPACQLWNVKCSRNVPLGIRASVPTVLLGILLTLVARHKHAKVRPLKLEGRSHLSRFFSALGCLVGQIPPPTTPHPPPRMLPGRSQEALPSRLIRWIVSRQNLSILMDALNMFRKLLTTTVSSEYYLNMFNK